MPFQETKEGQTHSCTACEHDARYPQYLSPTPHVCGKEVHEAERAIRIETLYEARNIVLNCIGLEMDDKFEDFMDRFDERLQALIGKR